MKACAPPAGLFCLLCLGLAAIAPAQEIIRSVPAIRNLPIEQRDLHLKTELEATVTFYHPDWGVLFVHDGQSGICVGLPESMRPQQHYRPGDKLRIQGEIGPGEFLPVLSPHHIESLGRADLPAFAALKGQDIFTPALDANPIELKAVVKGTSFSDECLVVELEVDGWRLHALLPQQFAQTELPWQLVERHVTVRGIVGTHFNDQRQMTGRLLFVPDLSFIVTEDSEEAHAEAPVVPVDAVLRVHSPLRQLVRIRGQVTHIVPRRGLYLRGQGGSLFVQTAQPMAIARGDEVEAEGYPGITAFRPSLNAMDVRKLQSLPPAKPEPFVASATRSSREQCELVTLNAELIDITPQQESTLLRCQIDGTVFESFLASPFQPTEELLPGMKLQLVGICELMSTHPLVIPRNATAFRILLRDPQDIVVLARAPWWNEQRAIWVLAALGALALAIAGWAAALQLMVRRQAGVIARQAEQKATLEERQRIARDLHDTLEQELVGVTMLLDTTSARLNEEQHSDATQPLHLARRLLRRAREESRTTIRELRSVTLEQRGLAAALDELLRPLAEANGVTRFSMQVTGKPQRLPGTVETHLLRIAQEAVANAARHAQAQNIQLHLSYADPLTLEVKDDGQGFDPNQPAAAGHFGLSGMRERADKVGGTLTLTSALGQGTTVHLQLR